jgi:hypothetical protein
LSRTLMMQPAMTRAMAHKIILPSVAALPTNLVTAPPTTKSSVTRLAVDGHSLKVITTTTTTTTTVSAAVVRRRQH